MPKKRKLDAKHARVNKPKPSPNSSALGVPKKHHKQQHYDRPTIPFSSHERILLLGEGDASYASSLVKHHRCTNVLATVLEKNEAELLEKYPHAEDNIAMVTAPLEEKEDGGEGEEDDDVNWEEDYGSDWDEGDSEKKEKKDRGNHSRVVYNIDATKPLPASISRPAPDRIIFNFPHVGGLSTDVNRQVRSNQSLLVSFFTSALAILSPTGSIVVTLFESEPYTLWNIRDLARHSGLQVERSFKFQWAAYPGYKHARTCGVIKGKKDGKEGAGWKGEERGARSYVFVRKTEEQGGGEKKDGKKSGEKPGKKGGEKVGKRKRDKEDEDDSD